MKGKGIGSLVAIMATLLMMCSAALAMPQVQYIKINGNTYETGDNLVVESGDTLDFDIKLQGNSVSADKDLEAEVMILGYEYNDVDKISDSTDLFDIGVNQTTYKKLSIRIPDLLDKDEYDVRLLIGKKTGSLLTYNYRITIEGSRHSIKIKDVIFSPEGEVMAGRAMLATVRIENTGQNTEDSIKVTVSIPSLGVSASDYIDELEEEDTVSSEELYLRIPSCTQAGVYNAKVEVSFDEGYEKVTKETSIRVVADETCYAAPKNGNTGNEVKTEKTVINIGATTMDVVKGEGGAVYPITITNMGSQSKIYTLAVDGTAGWGTVRVTPSNTIVVEAGETKAMYIYLTAVDDAAAGEHMFSVSVSSDSKVQKELSMKANVVGDNKVDATAAVGWDKVKRGLEIGLIVLLVLLVLLGLIVGFNKLKGDKEDEGQTYY